MLDEFGRRFDDISEYLKGVAYQDYFIFNGQVIYWEDVRHVEFKEKSKWFETDMFAETKQPEDHQQSAEDSEQLQLKGSIASVFISNDRPDE